MTRFLFLMLFAALAAFVRPSAAFAAEPNATPTPQAHTEDTRAKPSASPSPSPEPTDTPGPAYGNMQWREIGPALPGGRVTSVAGSASNPNLYLMGSAGGGVWKSTDGAETWNAVFEKEKVSAIGAVAIDPKNNSILWAATGETNPRNDVSYGDGIYKSVDGGKTWTNVGLKNTRHISKILIDPRDTNHVIVGALGDVFGDSEDRGVYITDDGGKTWTKTLYVSPSSGASDMAMNMQAPNVIYAGMWHFRREPWTFTSGGEDDGLYKSTDGGRTWNKLTGHGLPSGITGRIGLAVAPSDGNRIYALIESADGILWRSNDGGNTWAMINKNTLIVQRPFYFSHIEVDPKDPDHVIAVASEVASSHDGGKTFTAFARQVHVDYHSIWWAPNDSSRIIFGNDGGIARTVDGGATWAFGRNIPIGQVYRVATSLKENPYVVCGGWQDNNGWCGPSNSLDPSGILNHYWTGETGGDGQWVVPDPIDPNYVWADSQGGFLSIYNKVTKDTFFVIPWGSLGADGYNVSLAKYRFNWTSPIAFAPWDGHIGWLGGNVVFQTSDRGRHWTTISPDLTRNDKSHQQPSGGPITHDVSGAEFSDTILDIAGSPLRRGEIWVGTDDGLIQLTRNGGKNWKNVTPQGIPQYGRVETIAPSTIDDGTAYASVDGHVTGDFKPYLVVTHDFGKTWKSITNGLPADQYVRAVRPDLHNRNIVYAGTENGIWLSTDGGANWQDFKNNLPTVAVRDIRFQPEWNDLVIATHGRSLYVMDDMRPVQSLAQEVAQGTMLFAPRTAYQYNLHSDDEGTYTDYSGQNPPYGSVITFYQKTPGKDSPAIQILDASNHVIRTIKGTHKVNGKDVPYVTNKSGINKYTWDWNVDGPVKWLGAAKERYQGPNEGPSVPPGTYGVRMTLGTHTYTQHFTVKPDPRTMYTQKEIQDAFVFNKKYFREFSTVDTMLNTLDDVKKQLDAAAADPKAKGNTELQAAIKSALDSRTTLFDQLTANYQNDEDGIQRPGKLREDVGGPLGVGLVTPAVLDIGHRVDAEYAAGVQQFNAWVATLQPVNAALQAAGLKPLTGTAAISP